MLYSYISFGCDSTILYITRDTNSFSIVAAGCNLSLPPLPHTPPPPTPHRPIPVQFTPVRTSALFSKTLSPSDYFPSHSAPFLTVLHPSSHCPPDLRRNPSFKRLLAERTFPSISLPRATEEAFLFLFFGPYPLLEATVPPPIFVFTGLHCELFCHLPSALLGGSTVEWLKGSMSDLWPDWMSIISCQFKYVTVLNISCLKKKVVRPALVSEPPGFKSWHHNGASASCVSPFAVRLLHQVGVLRCGKCLV